jgi:hypothetical protein
VTRHYVFAAVCLVGAVCSLSGLVLGTRWLPVWLQVIVMLVNASGVVQWLRIAQRRARADAFAEGLEKGLEIGREERAFARKRREDYAYRRGQRDAWLNSN